MTLKQIIIRLFKEYKCYSILVKRFKNTRVGLNSCNAHLLYNFFVTICESHDIDCRYINKSFYEFLNDFCELTFRVNVGDIVTVKTMDQKYEMDYKVLSVDSSGLKFLVGNYNHIETDRIYKINGKKSTGWKLKRKL